MIEPTQGHSRREEEPRALAGYPSLYKAGKQEKAAKPFQCSVVLKGGKAKPVTHGYAVLCLVDVALLGWGIQYGTTKTKKGSYKPVVNNPVKKCIKIKGSQ